MQRRQSSGSKSNGAVCSTNHFSALALLLLLMVNAPLRAQSARETLPVKPAAETSPTNSGLTFEQIYELAARNNLQINAVRRRRAVADAGILIAGQRPNPDLITAYTRSEPRLNVSISQPVELGGKRGLRLEVARGEARLTEFDLETALRVLRRDVRVAYFNLALARDTVGLGRQSVEQAERLAGIAQARFEAGDIAQFEVLQAKLAVARATNDFSRLKNAERIARAGLNQLLNRPPDALIDLQESLFAKAIPPVALSALITRSLERNAELQAAEQQLSVERSRLKLARASRIPDLLLEPGIESIDPSLPNNYAFKMQVALPLPIFNRARGETARSNALIAQLTAERDAARQRIASEIGQVALRLEAARTQVDFYETNLLPDAERVRALSEEAYRAGQTGILPVVDAQRGAREIRQGYLQALFDYQSARAELEQTAGVILR